MKIFFILNFFALSALSAQFALYSKQVGTVQVAFLRNATSTENAFNLKASFADIEKIAPLSPSLLRTLKPEDLRGLTMEEFNQIYARLGSGPMPFGDYAGYILQKPPIYDALKKRILKKILLATEFAKVAKIACGREGEDCLFEFIWKGKRFWPTNSTGQIMTKTLFNPVTSGFKFPLVGDLFKSKEFDTALDFAEGLIDKASPTIFPMETYCGVSQVDTRRESIIADASFGDEFGLPHYLSLRDEMVTRKGLNITEEYRMLRAGLYIGKVYSNKLFLFNTALEKTGTQTSPETSNACTDTLKAL